MAEKVVIDLAVETGKSARNLGQLEEAAENLKNLLKKTDFGTKEFNELNQALKDVNREIKNTELNMEALDNEQVASELGSVAGAVGDVTAAFILLGGDEDSALAETAARIEKAIGVSMAFKGTIEGVISFQKLWNNTLKKTAVAQGIMTAGQWLYTTAVGASTGAMKLFRLALISTGIGAIIVGIGMLIANFSSLVDWVKNIGSSMGAFGKGVKKVIDIALAPLMWVIDAIKWGLQELGIIESEEEKAKRERAEAEAKRTKAKLEAIANQIKELEKLAKREKEISDLRIKGLDNEIKIQKSLGKETIELERQKLQAIITSTKKQDELTRERIRLKKLELSIMYDEINANFKLLGLSKERMDAVLKSQEDTFNKFDLELKKSTQNIKDAETDLLVFENNIKTERKKANTKAAEDKKKIDDKAVEDKKKTDNKAAEDKIKLEDEQWQLLQEITNTQQELELLELAQQYDKKFALAVGNAELEKALTEQQGLDIKAIEDKFRDAKAEADKETKDKEIADAQEVKDAKVQMATDSIDAIMNLTSAFAKDNEKSQKRAFEINKKLQIAQALMQTYQGVQAIFAARAASPESILFPAAPFIAASIALATGLANVQNIRKQQFSGGSAGGGFGGGGVGGGGGGAPTLQPVTNTSSLVPQEAQQVYVTETDITNTQNRVEVIESQATIK